MNEQIEIHPRTSALLGDENTPRTLPRESASTVHDGLATEVAARALVSVMRPQAPYGCNLSLETAHGWSLPSED